MDKPEGLAGAQGGGHVGLFHVAKAGFHQPGAERQVLHRHAVVRIGARLVGGFHGDEDQNVVQHAVVLQIVHEGAGRIDGIGLQEDGGAGHAGGLAFFEAVQAGPRVRSIPCASLAARAKRPRIQMTMSRMMVAPISTGM